MVISFFVFKVLIKNLLLLWRSWGERPVCAPGNITWKWWMLCVQEPRNSQVNLASTGNTLSLFTCGDLISTCLQFQNGIDKSISACPCINWVTRFLGLLESWLLVGTKLRHFMSKRPASFSSCSLTAGNQRSKDYVSGFEPLILSS